MYGKRVHPLAVVLLVASWACGEPTGVLPRPTFDVAGYSPSGCSDNLALDHDGDGFEDDCEYNLALAFRPRLALDINENCPYRETYWSAYPLNVSGSEHVYIAYLLAYHIDCGGSLPWPFSAVSGHDGDSEFIILDISWDPASASWKFQDAFLSAHWNSADGENSTGHNRSATYGASHFALYQGRPVIIVSRNKHANYDSYQRCAGTEVFTGINQEASCPFYPNSLVSDVEVRPDRNVGSSMFHLVNCTTSELPNDYPGTECFWTGSSFRGWRASPYYGPAPTPYGTALAFFEGRTGFRPRPDLGSFLATMTGPSNIVDPGYYAWEVNVDGGDGDYTYEWYETVDGSPWFYLGSDKIYYDYFDTSMNQSPRFRQFQVTMRDGVGHVVTLVYPVEESSWCGGDWCGGGG